MFHFTVPTEGQPPLDSNKGEGDHSAEVAQLLLPDPELEAPPSSPSSTVPLPPGAMVYASLAVDVPYLLSLLRSLRAVRPSIQCVQVYDFWN